MGPKKAKTRHSFDSLSCFGPPVALPDVGSLFTVRDVLAAVEMLKISNPEESNWWMCCQITPTIRAKWAETNPMLVLIKDESISKKMLKSYDTAHAINRKKAKSKAKEIFMEKLDHLFDILVCQCPINLCEKPDCNTAHCNGGAHISCSCLRQFKIPPMELRYILDQREKVGLRGGEMQIGKPDRVEAARQEKNKAKASTTTIGEDSGVGNPDTVSDDCNNNEVVDMEADDNFISGTRQSHKQNRTDLSWYTAEVIRYGVSDRAAAALYNAALKTINAIKEDDTTLVVDQSKIRRSRDIFSAKQKNIRKQKLQEEDGIKCFGSDGKRNKKTGVSEVLIINGEPKDKFGVKTREHIVYTSEPGGEYLCHSEVSKGTGRDLANDFVDVIAEHDSIDSIVAVVADGTNTNTGWKEGMIAHTERDLQIALLWLICLLHGIELGLRHWFAVCD